MASSIPPGERSPSKAQSGDLPWRGPSCEIGGERPDGQADQALGRASGRAADVTKPLLLSVLDPL